MNQILLLFLMLFCSALAQKLMVSSPPELVKQIGSNGTSVSLSPLGYKPQSGWLHGNMRLASPESACSSVQKISQSQMEDIFLFADDKNCLQSVKAKNLAEAGAFMGIIKKNINNTLHDRQINLVHMPVLQLDPIIYDKITTFQKENPNTTITIIADFNTQITERIQLEFWMTPTEKQSINFILQMKDFIINQPRDIGFHPRFVFHTQVQKKQYVGCYSSGKYCPAEIEYEGKKQGTKIVAQSLRQILIAQNSIEDWFNYAKYYYNDCLLKTQDLWKNDFSDICSENSMIQAGINSQEIKRKFNDSFEGPIPYIDQNFILEEQRQLYISQQITKYPSILINKKQQTKLDANYIERTICFKLHPNPAMQSAECQKLTNPSAFQYWQLIVMAGIVIGTILGVMAGYREYIKYKMRKQMRGQVDRTLQQYYRYMETFEEDDPSVPQPLDSKKEQTNQIGSIELSEVKKQ